MLWKDSLFSLCFGIKESYFPVFIGDNELQKEKQLSVDLLYRLINLSEIYFFHCNVLETTHLDKMMPSNFNAKIVIQCCL